MRSSGTKIQTIQPTVLTDHIALVACLYMYITISLHTIVFADHVKSGGPQDVDHSMAMENRGNGHAGRWSHNTRHKYYMYERV